MMKSLAKTAFALVLSATFAIPAHSQSAPGFLAQTSATYVGEIGGVPAFMIDGQEIFWFVLPNGAGIVAGYAFGLDGSDIGSEVIGKMPVGVWESFGLPEPRQEELRATAQDLPETSMMADILTLTESTVAGKSEEEKRALVADLVRSLDEARTPEEFRISLLRWRERVTGETILPQDLTVLTGPQAAPGGVRAGDDPEAGGAFDIQADRVTPPWEEPAAETVVPASMTEQEKFFDTMRRSGFWFSIGSAGAPVVYMIADPACPYCARAMQTLEPAVRNGSLQLRILLAPFVSTRSAPMIAGILLSEDPATAYWTHSLEFARRGSSQLAMREFSELSEAKSQGVRRNYDLVVDNSIPGVPFFAWNTPSGPQFVSGVAQIDRFRTALPDAFSGN